MTDVTSPHRIAFADEEAALGTRIGDVVLLRISPTVQRPLLVHTIHPGGEVSGVLFVNPEADRTSEWIVKNCFYAPAETDPPVQVGQGAIHPARPGKQVGEWCPR